jgi:hypothetical protein
MVNFRKNYSTTITPDNLWITCCSIPYSGGSIHSEDALIKTYNLLYGRSPLFIRNWRTIASGEIKDAKPCSQCREMLMKIGYSSIELYNGVETRTETLDTISHTMSSGTRSMIRCCN